MALGRSRSITTQTICTPGKRLATDEGMTGGFGWMARAQPSMRPSSAPTACLPRTPTPARSTCTGWTSGAIINYDSNGVIKLMIIDPGGDGNWMNNMFTMDLRIESSQWRISQPGQLQGHGEGYQCAADRCVQQNKRRSDGGNPDHRGQPRERGGRSGKTGTDE